MGWKNVKTHYRIGHMVAVYEGEGLCIGSPYVHNLIIITPGEIKWGAMGPSKNDDLARYYKEMMEDPALLAALIESPDTFKASIPVYTYKGGEIIEKFCEEPGWPNVTHDGCMMYENSFSTDRAQVVKWAKLNAQAGVEMAERRIKEEQERMIGLIAWRDKDSADLAKLNSDWP